jgi:hypothetical protein
MYSKGEDEWFVLYSYMIMLFTTKPYYFHKNEEKKKIKPSQSHRGGGKRRMNCVAKDAMLSL